MPITNYSYADSQNRRIQQLEDTIEKFMTENTILRNMYIELWNNYVELKVKIENSEKFDIGEYELYENTIEDLKEENKRLEEGLEKMESYTNKLEDENFDLKAKIDILNGNKKVDPCAKYKWSNE